MMRTACQPRNGWRFELGAHQRRSSRRLRSTTKANPTASAPLMPSQPTDHGHGRQVEPSAECAAASWTSAASDDSTREPAIAGSGCQLHTPSAHCAASRPSGHSPQVWRHASSHMSCTANRSGGQRTSMAYTCQSAGSSVGAVSVNADSLVRGCGRNKHAARRMSGGDSLPPPPTARCTARVPPVRGAPPPHDGQRQRRDDHEQRRREDDG